MILGDEICTYREKNVVLWSGHDVVEHVWRWLKKVVYFVRLTRLDWTEWGAATS